MRNVLPLLLLLALTGCVSATRAGAGPQEAVVESERARQAAAASVAAGASSDEAVEKGAAAAARTEVPMTEAPKSNRRP